MSTDVYAGQLCATHLNERVAHPDLDPALCWWLVEIRFSHRYDTTMVIAKGVNMSGPLNGHGDAWPKEVKVLKLATDDIVTVSKR